MRDLKQELADIYWDTEQLCRQDGALAQAIRASVAGTVLYPAGQQVPRAEAAQGRAGLLQVTKERSIEAAQRVHREHPDWRIAVHNFASATNPGGGVERGSSAQEESLCRVTTLHPCLKTDMLRENFYRFHRERRDVRYTDAVIYTPGVVVVKTDTVLPEPLPEQKRFSVDILTCAAPNLRERPYNAMNPGRGEAVHLSAGELGAIHTRRAEKLLNVSLAHGVDCVILGAFGCGAFRNDPNVVAQAYREVVGRYRGAFEGLVFAVYCPPRGSENYEVFHQVLGC